MAGMTTRIISTPAITRNRVVGGARGPEHHQPGDDHQDQADAGRDQPLPVALQRADQSLNDLAARGDLTGEPGGLQRGELAIGEEYEQGGQGGQGGETGPAAARARHARAP
jgi:hypothetical protein